jgi:hypothetical protein
MATKIIKLKEAIEFAKENGYLLAVYTKNIDNYDLFMKQYDEDEVIKEDTNIVVKMVGSGSSFEEFKTEDEQFLFVLHNTFNIPKTIPVK